MLKHHSSNRSHRWGAFRGKEFLVTAFFILAHTRYSQAAEPRPLVLCEQNLVCNEHMQKALNLYQSHDYEHALNSFRAAYNSAADPRLLVNIGRMLHLLERYQEAIVYYEKAIKADSGDAHLKQTARQHEAAAQAHLPPPLQPRADIRNNINVTSSPHVGPIQSNSAAYLKNISVVQVAPSMHLTLPGSSIWSPSSLSQDIKPSISRRWWLWTSIVTITAGVVITASLIAYAQPPNWTDAPTLAPHR